MTLEYVIYTIVGFVVGMIVGIVITTIRCSGPTLYTCSKHNYTGIGKPCPTCAAEIMVLPFILHGYHHRLQKLVKCYASSSTAYGMMGGKSQQSMNHYLLLT